MCALKLGVQLNAWVRDEQKRMKNKESHRITKRFPFFFFFFLNTHTKTAVSDKNVLGER